MPMTPLKRSNRRFNPRFTRCFANLQEGILPYQQTIIYNGKQLENNLYLADLKAKPFSQFFLQVLGDSMHVEIGAAVEWWRQRIQHAAAMQNVGHQGQFYQFAVVLAGLLETKYRNHWYPENPTRGQAYRSLLNDEAGPDPLLAQALVLAGLPPTLFGHQDVIMWIDSGNVSVRCKGGDIFELYTSANAAKVKSPKKTQPNTAYPKSPRRTSPHLREVVNAQSYLPSFVPQQIAQQQHQQYNQQYGQYNQQYYAPRVQVY